MQVIEWPVRPEAPHAELKQRILDEYCCNPFLDEDAQELELRLGAGGADLAEALAGLCRAGLLKSAGGRGYALNGGGPAAMGAGANEDEGEDTHGHAQEEMFERMRAEVVEPLIQIESFLDNPRLEELGWARAALAQIHGFLEDFLLRATRKAPPEKAAEWND